MKHFKKVWPEYFQKISEGKKTFELRLADWEYAEGDPLVLQEWDPAVKNYTGREIEKVVTYIAKTKDMSFFSKEDVGQHGYQIIAFRQKTDESIFLLQPPIFSWRGFSCSHYLNCQVPGSKIRWCCLRPAGNSYHLNHFYLSRTGY